MMAMFSMRLPALVRALAAGAAIVALTVDARAAILEDFQFGDADNTTLDMAVNSANAGNNWVHDTDHVATIQVLGGNLNIVKNNTDFVTEGLGLADVTAGTLWMVAEFSDWFITGSAPDDNNLEQVRFGFMATEDLIPPPSSTVLAEMMISRQSADGSLEISGTALGAAGTSIAPVAVSDSQTEPFVMAMKVDQDADTYALYYKDGANPFALAGTGTLEPTRDAMVVRMTINNFIGDVAGEQFNLDRFYVSDTAPAGIPEPTSVALAGLAIAGLALRRWAK